MTYGWTSSMEVMEEATKHPGPPLERTNHDAEPPFPPITEFTSLERILLGSLDNANTCCDAISFIKRVPAFAVWKSQEAHCENDEPEDPAAKGNQAKPSRCDIII
jgi:hypothetical protein